MAEVFPPTHHCLLVVFVKTGNKCLEEALRSPMSACKQLDRTIHSHFRAEVKSHFNLFKAVLISTVLINSSHSVTVPGPCHPEKPSSHLFEDFLCSIDLLVAFAVFGSPSIQVVLHVALVGGSHKLLDMLGAHVLT